MLFAVSVFQDNDVTRKDADAAWTEMDAKAFGTTLRRLRHEQGLSQETLAFTAGITKNQVQLLEAGRASGVKDSVGSSNPRISTLAGLARVLGMSVSKLLGQAGL